MRRLIDKRLGEETVLRVIDASPRTKGHVRWAGDVTNVLRRYCVRNERRFYGLVLIDIGVLPSDQLTVGIEARFESALDSWPIKVLLDVFTTRVNHLYRSTNLASNHSGLQCVIRIALSSKATAHKVVVQGDLL